MRDTWFWRVFAVMALLVALGFVVSSFTSGLTGASRVRAGGDGGYVMEIGTDQAGGSKAFVLDTNRKVLIMYANAPQKYQLTMLASRYIDVDCQATVGKEFPGKLKGWSLREVQATTTQKRTPRR